MSAVQQKPLPALVPLQAVTLHNTLCTFLGECSYPPRREVQLLLLHSREEGALLAAVNATLAHCVSGWPAVYRDDVRLLSKVGRAAGRGRGGGCVLGMLRLERLDVWSGVSQKMLGWCGQKVIAARCVGAKATPLRVLASWAHVQRRRLFLYWSSPALLFWHAPQPARLPRCCLSPMCCATLRRRCC